MLTRDGAHYARSWAGASKPEIEAVFLRCSWWRCTLEEGSNDQRRLYSNKLARLYLEAIEDVMGSNGVAAVLRLARLGHLIGDYPPDTLDNEFPFEDFAAINESIVEVYGLQGAKGLCLRAGRSALRHAVRDGGLMADVPDPAFQLLPVGAKVKVGLNALGEVLSKLTDQEARLEEREGDLVFVIEACSECWGRASDEPICYGTTGMVHEAVRWLTEEESFSVTETACLARGDDSCAFLISKVRVVEGVVADSGGAADVDAEAPD